jgi:hypothetical protein
MLGDFCQGDTCSPLTNLKVMLVWQRIVDGLDLRNSSENFVAHLVHCSLNTGAVVLGEDLHRNVPRCLPCGIKVNRLGLCRVFEKLPLPASLNVRAEDTIPSLRKLGVLVTVEAVESRSSALEHEQLLNLGTDRDALALPRDRLNHAELLAVAEERVWVRFAVNVHAGPSVLDDLDMCGMDVGVRRDEMVADNGGEMLGRVNGMLFGEDIGRLLLGIGRNHD